MENESAVAIQYGTVTVVLDSDHKQGGTTALGRTICMRGFPMTWNVLQHLSKAKGLIVTFGNAKFDIPVSKMAGIVALAKRARE